MFRRVPKASVRAPESTSLSPGPEKSYPNPFKRKMTSSYS